MIELIQFPWSPFCIVQRRLLEFSGARFKTTNLKLTGDRSLIWKLTKERYYAAPIIRDGRNVVFETSEDSQAIGKYLIDCYFSSPRYNLLLALNISVKAWSPILFRIFLNCW